MYGAQEMNKPNLTIMVGIPASGKSYAAEKLSDMYGSKIYSSDAYRKMLLGDGAEQSNNALVFNTLFSDMKKDIENGCNCIFDATNTTIKSRKRVLDLFGDIADVDAFVMTTDVKECVTRDVLRERYVGKDVIYKFLNSYQFPQMFEGFNNIIIWDEKRNNYSETLEKKYMREMDRFDQKNPHHKYNLGTHCRKLAEHFDEADIRYLAGLWHDVGKLFTQKIDENGVAHYYNHDSVSTYFILSNLDILPFSSMYLIGELLFYVNYHMKIRDLERDAKDSTKQKYRELFGTDYSMASRYDKLVEFMQADNEAGHK